MAANDGNGEPILWTDDGDYLLSEDDDDVVDGVPSTAFKRSPLSSETIQDILFLRVFPFLPVRSLLRLGAVHPEWRRRLSVPLFSHRQTMSNRSFSGLFSCDSPSFYIPFHPSSAHALPDPYLSFLPFDTAIHVLASSGGLLCCSTTLSRRSLVICNPATRDFAELPLAPFDADAVVLEFTPCPRNISGDYRIVCVSLDGGEESGQPGCRFAVFDSSSGSWRCSNQQITTDDNPRLRSPHGVSAGGKAHWRTVDGSILRYDPDGDRTSVVRVPAEAEDEWASWELGELDGMLCCASASSETGNMVVDALMEDEEGSRWERLRCFGVADGLYVRPLTFEGGDGDVLAWVGESVMGFSIRTGDRRVLCDAAEWPVLETAVLRPYISTLAFVKKSYMDERATTN